MTLQIIGPMLVTLTHNSHFFAEILALKVGLDALEAKGYMRVMVETDSSQVVNHVHGYISRSN